METKVQVEQFKLLLEEQFPDSEIPNIQEGAKAAINWDELLVKLQEIGKEHLQRETLEMEFTRTVTVTKDQRKESFHRTYQIYDTLLQTILRRSPPSHVMAKLAEISPAYKISKTIFDLIRDIEYEDEEWTSVHKQFHHVVKQMGTESLPLLQRVCRIRHTWREETLLMISARRNPPLSVIKRLLGAWPESVATVDTALYDWIPLNYAISYGISDPNIIICLIPPLEMRLSFDYLTQHDVYNRTTLHWAVFYGVCVDVVAAVVEDVGAEALTIKDGGEITPYELAVQEGASMDVVEVVLPNEVDFEMLKREMVRSCIGHYREYSDRENELQVSSRNYTFLAKEISRDLQLQKIVRAKSCETLATVVVILDFYASLLLLVSFRRSYTAYLSDPMQSDHGGTWFYVLQTVVAYMLLRDFFRMIMVGIPDYVTNVWDMFDLTTMCLIAATAIVMHFDQAHVRAVQNLVIIAAAFVWMNLLIFLRSTFLQFAVFVSGLQRMILDLIPFIITSILLLGAFAEMYSSERRGSGVCATMGDSEFCEFGDALTTTYTLFIGGMSIDAYSTTNAMKWISILYGFLIIILLLNVVIAIVSVSWTNVSDNSAQVFWLHRLNFLTEVKGYESLLLALTGSQELHGLRRVVHSVDSGLNFVVKQLWLRKGYWGHFDSVVDRMCSQKYGSFSWQFRHEWAISRSFSKTVLLFKATLLLIVFWMFALVWFVLGLVTCGIMWPKTVRTFVFGHTITSEPTPLEAVDTKISEMAATIEVMSRQLEQLTGSKPKKMRSLVRQHFLN